VPATGVAKMKKEIAELWAEALRSGRYKQIKNQLANKKGHSCLGVLCELAIESGVRVSRKEVDKNTILFDGEKMFLPDSVTDWAGIGLPWVSYYHPVKACLLHLADLNREGYSFKKIANLIEDYWEEM
jgi:hypothetical protein